MKRIILILLFYSTLTNVTFGQQEAKTRDVEKVLLYENGTGHYADSIPSLDKKNTHVAKLEVPKINAKDKIITHTGYSFLYSETHEQAYWVAYNLTKEETTRHFKRTDQFLPDPSVTTETASDKDYKKSGYDRGHLAPAADMGWSATAMAESFYYSNMSPQKPGFNRGIWKKLEELVRTWAVENQNIYIVTGPVLTNELQTIGPNGVSVPNYYYKVILDYSEPNIKSIGFILPNSSSKEPLENFAVPIDRVEKMTGIDFFPLLEDPQEEALEKTLCVTCWSWHKTKSKNKKAKH